MFITSDAGNTWRQVRDKDTGWRWMDVEKWMWREMDGWTLK